MQKQSKIKKRKQDRQTRYLAQAIQLEETVNPHIIRGTVGILATAIFIFIGWAALTNINEVARASGEVVPMGNEQIVDHLDGGLIEAIHVTDGEFVTAGALLITLSDTDVLQDLKRARAKDTALALEHERLAAFIDDRQPDFARIGSVTDVQQSQQQAFFAGMTDAKKGERQILMNRIADKRQTVSALNTDLQYERDNLDIMQDMNDRRLRLQKQGFVSEMEILTDRRNLNQAKAKITQIENEIVQATAAIENAQAELDSLTATQKDEVLQRLSALENDRAQNDELIEKLQSRLTRLDIRAPTEGMVKGLAVNTIGGVVKPGMQLMHIVPVEKGVEVAVRINPKDIGHIRIGQPVQVKFSTYDFSRYGFIDGVLSHISPGTFDGAAGERFYEGRIQLSRDYIGEMEQNTIMPGMTVMADIITGRKTILEYMVKPIHRSMKSALSER